MARRHLRSDFSTDTDDLSLETTVPTDFSLSPDEFSELADSTDRKKRISKQLLERKQLLHDLQVVKIELSQKSLLLDNVKAEYMQKAEELEEKLADALHQKQILQARLESELKIQQEDAKRRQENIQKELDTILRRQKKLESTNERLQEKAVDVRQSLKDLELTENQYYTIKEQPDDELPLKDYVAVKLFETLRPWKIENSELKSRCRAQGDELHRCNTNWNRCKDDLEDTKHKLSDLEMKHQRLTLAFADMKTQVKAGDFKIENYDRVKKERDEFDSELTDLRKQLAYLEASNSSTTKERDDLNGELISLRQQTTLLKQDKEFYAKQVAEFQNKLLYNEEKAIQLNDQLDRAKQSREELYDKYVASRDQYKTEYEAKLRDELEQIRVRTNTEIDRLKSSTRELFERENRNLREARDLALSERDRAIAGEKDVQGKYEQLLNDYRQTQMNSDSKISDLSNDVKIKAFEVERIQIVYDEAMKNFRESQLENDKTTKKLEVLTKEYFTLQTTMERNIAELESQIKEKEIKLNTYEQLEHELDDVVMQAAEAKSTTFVK
ncbi:hypothetical protein CAPTEDRAFT_192595 [Capitella teleta]|uniref:Progesterone immunomodulatory binding factor 1 n=1 Tax=Capitella teleta TaxID=283909 RepID=R7VAP7_CAPTE|nr:hypothetical protein CAPTEDRAFT_192595 [Capitella teleta]|eukprot:ELU12770.1 hypothetical protein CAPTEDRAFT_192595 [Capitella teleta]